MTELKRARRRIRELESALKPFAREATEWASSVSDSYRPGVTEPRKTQAFAKARFNIGHLRRAYDLVGSA